MLEGVLTVICSPMIFDGELIGFLYADFREATREAAPRIEPGDRELFEALASLAATAIQTAKFYRDLAS